ncbi:MAG: hypothetical protein ACPGXY_02065 [Alphaproteobacteria bacterium]
MTFHFAWVQKGEKYNPKVHNREDEAVFSLAIRQREAGFAVARVLIKRRTEAFFPKPAQQYCYISRNNQLLFKGRLIALPSRISGELIGLDITAEPEDQVKKLQALTETLKQGSQWDPLYLSPDQHNDPVEPLNARSSLYCWSRFDGSVKISDLFNGSKRIDIAQNHFPGFMKVESLDLPLDEVTVDVRAEWLQEAYGEIDVGPLIEQAFPHGYINTLNGKGLQTTWWQAGYRLQQGRYKIRRSNLNEVFPHQHAKATPELWSSASEKVRYKRYWFRADMSVRWKYQQKRREIASFTLKNDTQITSGRSRHLNLALQRLVGPNYHWRTRHRYTAGFKVVHQGRVYRCKRSHTTGNEFEVQYWTYLCRHHHVCGQSSRATFFNTDRGVQALRYAFEVARAHLAASSRSLRIKFTAEFDKLKDITTDHTVTIKDSRLPGGRAAGKVVAYDLIADGNTGKQLGQVTLAVAIGRGRKNSKPLKPKAVLFEQSYAQEVPLAESQVTQSGVHYACWHRQLPRQGHHNPSSFNSTELVESVVVENPASAQIEYLEQNQYPVRQGLQQVLQEKPTRVQVRMKDLTSEDVLEHRIEIKMKDPWSPPKQIDLAGK